MTLIAVLLLYPTPMVHARGLERPIPRDQLTRAFGPIIRDRRSVLFSGDPAGGGGCEDEEWGDGDGAEALLGWPALPRRFRQDVLPCHSPTSQGPSSLSLRSRQLRC
jgi:hypothetical protein